MSVTRSLPTSCANSCALSLPLLHSGTNSADYILDYLLHEQSMVSLWSAQVLLFKHAAAANLNSKQSFKSQLIFYCLWHWATENQFILISNIFRDYYSCNCPLMVFIFLANFNCILIYHPFSDSIALCLFNTFFQIMNVQFSRNVTISYLIHFCSTAFVLLIYFILIMFYDFLHQRVVIIIPQINDA